MGKKLAEMPRFTRALMRSHLLTCGYTYEDTEKPIIGVVNSWNEINHGHIPQKAIAEKVKEGIWSAGGFPLEFHTIAPCDAFGQGNEGMKYILPGREVIADSIEVMVRSQGIFDGLVFISSCDKITPAMLMAALRLDLPCIHIPSGPCVPSISFAQSQEVRRKFINDEITEKEMAIENAKLYSHPGICPYMGTANTMNCVAEALGISLPGSALIPACSGDRTQMALRTGVEIVRAIKDERIPSHYVTIDSFENALRVMAAISGSLNHLLHIPAIAHENGILIDFQKIDEINSDTPLLCEINPNGTYSVSDLAFAGGIPAVMKELRSILKLNCQNVEGKTVEKIIEEAENLNPSIIHPFDHPVSPVGGIVILKGNIARDGAALRRSTIPGGMKYFRGKALVFNSEEEALQAIEDGKIYNGCALVIRYEGPKGSPGMREMHRIAGAIKSLGDKIALLTDGRFSGASGGISIGYISPEAAQNGEIGIVEDGDEIVIDIEKKSLDLLVDNDVIRKRMKAHQVKEITEKNALLRHYSCHVGPTVSGAVRISCQNNS